MINIIRYANAPALEVTWFDENNSSIKCQVYGVGQMSQLKIDVGTEAATKFKSLIAAIEKIPLPVVEKQVPQSCTPAQGLVALFVLKNITQDQLNAKIDAIEDPVLRYTTCVGFTRATEWRRASPSMSLMGEILSLTDYDLDELFTYAATVEV